MCDNLQKENKDLEVEVKLLKAKVTRLQNKMAYNQKQWVETFQNQIEEDQQYFAPTNVGKLPYFLQFYCKCYLTLDWFAHVISFITFSLVE